MAVQRSEHDNKFDRQMRLWGGHGQKQLETAHICVLGSGPTASECLKNLVLPNVGEFTIVDSAKVEEADLGNNFFLAEESLGRPRAEAVKEFLLEMNGEVKGNHIVKDPESIVNDEKFLSGFRLVIACNLSELAVLTLSKTLHKLKLPLVVLRSYGLIGSIRLQVEEQFVVESHYDNDRFDLYLHPEQLATFPELQEYFNSFDLSKITDTKEHAHIPYPVILAYAMKMWSAKHKKIPTSFEEKEDFKASIKSMSRNYHDEENFQQAVQFAYRAYDKPAMDSGPRAVFEDSKANDVGVVGGGDADKKENNEEAAREVGGEKGEKDDEDLGTLSMDGLKQRLLMLTGTSVVGGTREFFVERITKAIAGVDVGGEGSGSGGKKGGTILRGKRARPEDSSSPVKQTTTTTTNNNSSSSSSSSALPSDNSKGGKDSEELSDWWILVRAVKRFMAQEGQGFLPCSRAIPDFVSETHNYVALKNIFNARAERDESLVGKHTQAILKELGRKPDSISAAEISHFVRNVRGVCVVRTGLISEELDPKSFRSDNANEALEEYVEVEEGREPIPKAIEWYFGLRAVDIFYAQNKRYPGVGVDEGGCRKDSNKLFAILTTLYKSLNLGAEPDTRIAEELTRFGATEIHNIAAYIGGVGAEAVLKTLIQQYVPLNNTHIFNGVHTTAGTWQF